MHDMVLGKTTTFKVCISGGLMHAFYEVGSQFIRDMAHGPLMWM